MNNHVSCGQKFHFFASCCMLHVKVCT